MNKDVRIITSDYASLLEYKGVFLGLSTTYPDLNYVTVRAQGLVKAVDRGLKNEIADDKDRLPGRIKMLSEADVSQFNDDMDATMKDLRVAIEGMTFTSGTVIIDDEHAKIIHKKSDTGVEYEITVIHGQAAQVLAQLIKATNQG